LKLVASLEGVHGCGKTTVFTYLRSKRPEWVFFPEFLEEPMYPFGSKDKQVAFRAELWVFQQMLKRNELISRIKEGVIVCDRSPICVIAYSHALCSRDDYILLENLYRSVNWREDLIFYFDESLEDALFKIKKRRGRPEEWNEDDPEYVAKVLEGYEKAFRNFTLNVVKVRNSDIEKLGAKILSKIEEYLEH